MQRHNARHTDKGDEQSRRKQPVGSGELAVSQTPATPISEDAVALLRDPSIHHPANGPRRIQAIARLQLQEGNQQAQRLVRSAQGRRNPNPPSSVVPQTAPGVAAAHGRREVRLKSEDGAGPRRAANEMRAGIGTLGALPMIQREPEGWSPHRRGGAPGVPNSPFYNDPTAAPEPDFETEVLPGLRLQAAQRSFAQWFLQNYEQLLDAFNPPRVAATLAGTSGEPTFSRPSPDQIRQLTEIYHSLETLATEHSAYLVQQRDRLQETVGIWDLEYQTAETQREVLASSVNLSFQDRPEYRKFRAVMLMRPPDIRIPDAMSRWTDF